MTLHAPFLGGIQCHITSYKSVPYMSPISNTRLSSKVKMIITYFGKVIIGDNFHSGRDILITISFYNYEGHALPYNSTYINKDVIIEDNVWIGARVIILGVVKISEGAIIQAGSVITKCLNDIRIQFFNTITKFSNGRKTIKGGDSS